MEELIKLLREAREKKGISLEQISELTKIQLKLLNALEKGDFTVFAGDIYLKGVINNYAKLVDLDLNEVTKMYNEARQKDKENKEKAVEPQQKPNVDKTKERPIRSSNKHASAKIKKREIEAEESMSVFTTGIFVLLVLLLAGGVWFVLFRDRGISEETADYTIPSDMTTIDDEENGDGPEIVEEDLTVLEILEEGYADTVMEITGTETIEVLVTFDGGCWVDFRTDDVSVYQKTFRSGDEISANAEHDAWIRLGNPPAVKLYINGIMVDGLSEKRSPHNYHMVINGVNNS